jgi:hypothetical protein
MDERSVAQSQQECEVDEDRWIEGTEKERANTIRQTERLATMETARVITEKRTRETTEMTTANAMRMTVRMTVIVTMDM